MEAQRTPAQWFALLAGLFLAAVGVLTLAFNDVDFGATRDPTEFLIWKVSGWNTILWMAMGVIGLFSSMRVDASRAYGIEAMIVFGALAVWGFVDTGYDTMGVFGIGTAGNITHAIIGGLGAVAASMPESVQRDVSATGPQEHHPLL
ncbi:MAG: DUF4383 domain-containing protein [Solirubrobacteraceae bacterium]